MSLNSFPILDSGFGVEDYFWGENIWMDSEKRRKEELGTRSYWWPVGYIIIIIVLWSIVVK